MTRRAAQDPVRTNQVADSGPGIGREEERTEVCQLPILADLPEVGLLFKSTIVTTSHSERVVVQARHIDRGAPAPADLVARYEAVHETSLISMKESADENIKRTPLSLDGCSA
ncbi:MAG: hypothetical protein JSW27_25705 [Phycisphaerales bacterium]|nr:MAG: hypothetical protein JSW27_25705 [Phycisphaerales bacterium]